MYLTQKGQKAGKSTKVDKKNLTNQTLRKKYRIFFIFKDYG